MQDAVNDSSRCHQNSGPRLSSFASSNLAQSMSENIMPAAPNDRRWIKLLSAIFFQRHFIRIASKAIKWCIHVKKPKSMFYSSQAQPRHSLEFTYHAILEQKTHAAKSKPQVSSNRMQKSPFDALKLQSIESFQRNGMSTVTNQSLDRSIQIQTRKKMTSNVVCCSAKLRQTLHGNLPRYFVFNLNINRPKNVYMPDRCDHTRQHRICPVS